MVDSNISISEEDTLVWETIILEVYIPQGLVMRLFSSMHELSLFNGSGKRCGRSRLLKNQGFYVDGSIQKGFGMGPFA
jgi:hypothetical protein